MVQQSDAAEFRCYEQSLGDLHIFLRRGWLSAWVIVGHDNGCRIGQDCRLKHFAGMR